jgi:triacylglycerol lipase
VYPLVASYLRQKGFDPYAINLEPSNGKVPLEALAEQVRVFVEKHLSDIQTFDVVAFSMGTLVVRCYIQQLRGDLRVNHLVMISGPHKGSPWAYLFKRPGFKQMQPNSDFLQNLNRDLSIYEKMKVLSLWTPLDVTVPAWKTIMPEFPHQKMWVLAHPLMMDNERVFEKVLNFLDS